MDDDRFVFEALTRFNYFPNQKQGVGEIPPIFTSRRFTPEVVLRIIQEPDAWEERKKHPETIKPGGASKGFDFVEYASTRYNNVPRLLGIPHPQAYGRLSKCIVDNWEHIKGVCDNESSKIKPYFHADKRLVVMNYDSFREKVLEKSRTSFGKRYLVNTDVASCFNSVYTHAIEWAGMGEEEAKRRLGGNHSANSHWSKDLDKWQRNTRRLETQGITIGPATSTIIVEIILGTVDARLREAGHEFVRYVDDYVCYCTDSSDAELFLQQLSGELKKFKFSLNLSKTRIEPLPAAIQTDWVAKLHAALPQKDSTEKKYNTDDTIHFLEYAISLNNQTPDGSVLKYAVQQLIYLLDDSWIRVITDYLINLSWHYPLLLPYVGIIFEKHEIQHSDYEGRLNEIIIENSKNGRSDGMCWPLYFISQYGLALSPEAEAAVINSQDCLSICILMEITGWTVSLQQTFETLSQQDVYQKDRQWIFLYQAFIRGHIANPYESCVFDIMKDMGVDFMPKLGEPSLAESYCTHLECAGYFAPDKAPDTYDEFVQRSRA
ncbi:antiviral reverse transcriptase Drt4 [Pseudomonas sp. Ps21-P2]|uniref:antiviral reverse transcriptase Drt4 n=1 Tax=Pseudomonas sp. Ps21-P2 TaxID=3080331 RepID=UPI00320B14EA